MKRIFWICLLILGFVLSWGVAYADGEFYVIAGGKKARRTILVSPKSTPSESGTALLNALSKITDASDTNSYLIIIEPGIYNIGSSALQMKSYVDIQGSGENVTKITGTIDNIDSGVVRGVNNVEIRFLTVENTGGGTYSIGFYNSSCTSFMTNMTGKASGGTNNYGVRNYDSSPIMNNVTATASGGTHARGVFNESSSPDMTIVTADASGATNQNYGVYNYSSSPVMNNVTAEASGGSYSYGVINSTNASPVMTYLTAEASDATSQNYGVYNTASSTAKIDFSVISGEDNSVSINGGTVYIANTRIEGAMNAISGILVCFNVCNETYNSYTCP